MGDLDYTVIACVIKKPQHVARHKDDALDPYVYSLGILVERFCKELGDDLDNGFICAETISFADFVACNGEQGAKDAGKMRVEGRDYIVQDGDVFHFRFNVSKRSAG